MTKPLQHDATASALGFRYQERYALLQLLQEKDDEAAVAVEALDDIQLSANGIDLVEQLKHSLSSNPTPLDIKSGNLWTTLRIWSELLPQLDLQCTQFRLVAVAEISKSSSLACLQVEGSDRTELLADLYSEAKRIREEIEAAKLKGEQTPHKKKAPGAAAFLFLSDRQREQLIERVSIVANAVTVSGLETEVSNYLDTYPAPQRAKLAARLCEWWDRQMLLSFDGKRDKFIKRYELLEQLSETSAMLRTDALLDSYSSKLPPPVFHTDEMLAKQCELVNAPISMINQARISEWQARSQRSEWSAEAPSKHSKVVEYDERLVIEWNYKHETSKEAGLAGGETAKATNGLHVLKWTIENAPQTVGTIEATVTSPFYVRGSYQVLAIAGRVGWHPDYRKKLGFDP